LHSSLSQLDADDVEIGEGLDEILQELVNSLKTTFVKNSDLLITAR